MFMIMTQSHHTGSKLAEILSIWALYGVSKTANRSLLPDYLYLQCFADQYL